MKLLHATALTAVLMTAAVPSLTSSAHAWDWAWRGGGWGWGGVSVGEAAGALIGVPVSSYACGYPPAYGYGFGYPAYCYGYGTGYSYPLTGVTDTPIAPMSAVISTAGLMVFGTFYRHY